MNNDNSTTLIRAVFFALIVAAAVGSVIYLKSSSDVPLTPEGIATRDSLLHMAKPDTGEDGQVRPGTSDDTLAAPTDSISLDVRTPADAGYEDGYYAGITDGVTGDERASYDESSQFPTANDRRTYADAYRRGYAQGYADGLEGKEFGIVPNGEEEEEE